MSTPSTPPELTSFATVGDARDRGYAIVQADEAAWTVALGDVSDALRARGRRVGYDLDAAIAAGTVTQRTAKRITVAAAARFKTAPKGPQVSQETAGPFSRSFTPADVAMYVRADEIADLGIPATTGAHGTFGDDPSLPDVFSPPRTVSWCSTPV